MSKVGDVDKMYGKNFSIVTTNASASDILNDNESSFIEASLILASPVDDYGNDLGYPTLLATDAEGKAIRLTYTIKPGNGLVLAYTYASNEQDFSEVISLAIDSDTLQTTEAGNLYVSAYGLTENSEYISVDARNNIEVDIVKLIDNNRLVLTKMANSSSAESYLKNRITVDASKIVDGITLISTENTNVANLSNFKTQLISVNLPNIIDNSTIKTILTPNGREVLAADSNKMDKATSSSYGVVKIDNSTIKTNPNGSIYVDTNKLRLITPKGGVGIVRLQAQGKSDLYVDNSGIVRTDPKNMPKCNVVDKSKTSNGFGVCAVDGKTIMATHDGVLKVISAGLTPASTISLGVVKPDNKTITIDNSGTLTVNANNLPVGTATIQGLLKYDNSTIVKNAQGQISVSNASKWDSAINDLTTQLASLYEQIAKLQSDLNNVLSGVVNATNVPFNLYTTAGKELNKIFVTIPNISAYKNGIHIWETSSTSGSFNLKYGAGYPFKFLMVNSKTNSWVNTVNIVINGQEYGPNQEIKMSSNTAVCSLKLYIEGYGSNKNNRSDVSTVLDFRDSAGNPLKSIILTIKNPIDKTSMNNFTVEFNTNISESSINSLNLDENSLNNKMVLPTALYSND